MAVSRYVHNVKGNVGYKGTFSDYLPLYLDGKGKIYGHSYIQNPWHKYNLSLFNTILINNYARTGKIYMFALSTKQ